ncbi:MAG: TIGR03960 family B12-binding radical SAM protein [Acidobacteriota bacterium]
MHPTEIRHRLDAILPRVQRPGRYLGLERNQVVKEWGSVAVRLLLAFPDEYGIGMSHQGTRLLYHLANRRDDTLCERAFAPWPDMAAAMREVGVPLYSLESYHPAREFDLLGITLQSELNYVNIPYLLDLTGIARWAGERREADPLVVGGGPCMANPEPVAGFFDVLAIGDGERLLPTLLDAVRDARADGTPREELLRTLASQDGFYVPGFYQWVPAPRVAAGGTWNVLDPSARFPVTRVFVDALDPGDVPDRPLVPAVEVVQDRLGMEVVRGCTQGCRFCQAGYWYRPVREHDPATVLRTLEAHVDATGYEEVGLLSLSTADYSQIEPLAYHLAERLAPRRVGVSLPSLRAESFSVAVVDAVSRVRKSGFTFAPETGSDRLRRVINKTFTNADMIAAAEVAYARGWNLIKLYAMIGLPTETDDDLEELARLAEGILAAARRVGNRQAEVKVSVGPYVPKSWTPFQWEPFVPVAELDRRIAVLRERFKRIRHARLTWNDPAEAALEAVLSRGDRRLGPVIARAHDLGAVFDGWHEWLRLDAWRQALADGGIDLEGELGERDSTATFPWDVIDPRVRRGYLRAERRRGLAERATPDCRWGDCVRCGIPGDGNDTSLALSTLPVIGEVAPVRARAAAYRLRPLPRLLPEGAPLTQPDRQARHRFTFAKLGDARWLSHRNVMDLLERALRAAAVPVRYTEGYNPHIRVSMGPALALGHESRAEFFDVDCHAPVDDAMLGRANAVLPDGLRLLEYRELPAGAASLGKAVAACRYRIVAPPGFTGWPTTAEELAQALARADAQALGTGILAWSVDGSVAAVTLDLRPAASPKPGIRPLLAALGISGETAATMSFTREVVLLAPGGDGTAA